MPYFSYHTIISTILFLFCIQFSNAGNNETDREALLEIRTKLSDPLGALSSWNDSLDLCSWHGVTCGRMHRRVTALDLQSSRLSGSLSPYIGNLSFLKDLELQGNNFVGVIPPEIGRLHRLQKLGIFNNSFTGEIPSNISGCYALQMLGAANNKLVGHIPHEIGSLLNLGFLSLFSNNLTGNIPSSLGNLSSLSTISIDSTNLVGSIPSSFGRLKNLTYLALPANNLSGVVPSSIFNLSRLTTIDLGENHFQGSLPSDIGDTLPSLQYFSIFDNLYTGVIPTSLSNLSNLQTLQLNTNNLRGKVPSLKRLVNLTVLLLGENSFWNGQKDDLEFVSSLGNATMLSQFDISTNGFFGVFPKLVCNFSKLSVLFLQENKLTGEIPSCIENLVDLLYFKIANNQITGVIPQNIGMFQKMEILYLQHNQLSGYIPSSVGNLTKVGHLILSRNNLVGQIPLSIGNCTNLLQLDLSLNNLTGNIPSEIVSLSALSIELLLFSNHLTGPLKSEIGQLKNLIRLDISRNMLSGEIPTSLSACVALEVLHMDVNFFEGAIPDALKTLTSLKEAGFSYNNLSGKIPEFLERLPLQSLNLSYNNFTGEVPVGGVFSNSTDILIAGNGLLCGGIAALKLNKCLSDNTRAKKSDHRKSLILAVIFGSLGVITFVTIVSLSLFRYIKRSKETITTKSTRKSLSNFTYRSLLKATNGFSSDNLIGSGTYGVVYKGIVEPDETLVAIKVFKLEYHGASKSFVVECEVLRNIKHRNLLKVITVCSSIDYQGNDFKALIYEFMSNGSLEDWLHSEARSRVEGVNPAHLSLNFRRRLDIAVDIAFAMEYLHYGYGESIVHCDLKPSNILLDEDMVAHVSDFGLAKFLGTSQAFQSSTLGFRGTIGYAPPEYGLGNEVTTSGDVYSFGILLMEMVTGKRPTSEMFKNGLSLYTFVHAALPEHVTEIIDGALLEEAHVEDTETRKMRMEAKILEASSSILGLALSCSAEVPQERVDMKQVVSELTAIRNRFHKT